MSLRQVVAPVRVLIVTDLAVRQALSVQRSLPLAVRVDARLQRATLGMTLAY